MQKFIRVLFAIILSTLIVSPVHAEETGDVEFIFRNEETWPEGGSTGVEYNSPAKIVFSGLEPNKSYEVVEKGHGYNPTFTESKPHTADENGNITIPLSGIYTDHDTHITIKGVSQVNYYIDYPIVIDAHTRHQSDIEVYHNYNLVDTTVGKRNLGVKTSTYTISASSTEKVLLKNKFYSAFSTMLSIGYSDIPKQSFKYTLHITDLDPEDTVFLRYGNSSTTSEFIGLHAVNNEITYDFEMGNATTTNAYVASIPKYAKVSFTQHENSEDFVPNYTLSNGLSSENTIPGVELTIPQIGYSSDNPYQYIQIMNLKAQAVTVGKTVEGNQGNRHEQFNFSAKIISIDEATWNDMEYTGTLFIAKKGGTMEQITPDENNVYKFKLQHGDTIKLFGFDGIIRRVTITEEDNDYTTKMVVNDEQPVDGKETTVNIENANASIRYINSKSLIVPTGINLPIGGAVLLVVGASIVLISKRRKQMV